MSAAKKSSARAPKRAHGSRAVAVRESAARAGQNGRAVVPLKERRLNLAANGNTHRPRRIIKYLQIAPRHGLFINGRFVAPKTPNYFPSVNPATEEQLTEIAAGGLANVDLAVRSARRAFDGEWGGMPARERGKYLYRIARIIQEKSRELAVLETMDGGKPIKESRDVDLPLAAAHFFYYAGWADKLAYAFPGRSQNRWVSPARLFRGISHC